MKISYKCDCCNRLYDTAEECERCEKSHVFLDSNSKDVVVACKFVEGDIFPTDITILSSDGVALATYHGNIRGNDARTRVSR